MKKEQNTSLKHLEEQLQSCKEQDDILEKIETALYEMKEIASLEKQLRPSQITH